MGGGQKGDSGGVRGRFPGLEGMEYYEVLNQLAQGGQGITSRVKRKQDNAVVVLKQSFCDNAKAGNSALREAKTLQGLDHPHIVRYEDVFLTEDGRQLVVCLIMAYMEGGDMARYMITVKKHGMTIEPNRVVTWSKQMMSAIAYLHSSKIVHRDLKPQNVFMQDDNNLKIGDFGLAQTIERGKRTSHVGTPCYMAPEVLQNDAVRALATSAAGRGREMQSDLRNFCCCSCCPCFFLLLCLLLMVALPFQRPC